MFWRDNIAPDILPAKVLLKRGEFIDSARKDREVPWKLYYPVDHDFDSLPVIFWSHGFGGSRDGASFLSRFLASNGYIVFHPTHRGTDSSLWEGKEGHPWDILRKHKTPRSASINRFLDIPFALDQLKNWAAENPDVCALADFEALGMSGHSFGAMTTQVIAGQKFPSEEDVLTDLSDNRFKAGILYSPVPISHLTNAPLEDIYGSINIPLLHMTGTNDDSPIEGFDFKHRLDIYNHTTQAPHYLLIKKDGDHMVYNGTRGKLDANVNRERHEDIVKMNALAFWDAYLRDDKKALAWLTEGGLVTYIGEDAEFKVG